MEQGLVAKPNGSEIRIAALTADLSEIQEAMADNIGSEGISRFALPKIKVPTGGETEWRVPSPQGPRLAKEITVLVVGWREGRAYYKSKYGEGGTTNKPPDCSSEDGRIGFGTPGGDCGRCPLAKFGSGVNNAQGCKNFRVLAVLRPENLMPEVVTVPPTSLKACRGFFYNLASGGVSYWGTLITIGLNRTKNAQGTEYAEMTFQQAGERFSGDIKLRARGLSKMWGEVLAAHTSVMQQAQSDASAGGFGALDNLPQPPVSNMAGL